MTIGPDTVRIPTLEGLTDITDSAEPAFKLARTLTPTSNRLLRLLVSTTEASAAKNGKDDPYCQPWTPATYADFLVA